MKRPDRVITYVGFDNPDLVPMVEVLVARIAPFIPPWVDRLTVGCQPTEAMSGSTARVYVQQEYRRLDIQLSETFFFQPENERMDTITHEFVAHGLLGPIHCTVENFMRLLLPADPDDPQYKVFHEMWRTALESTTQDITSIVLRQLQ